MLVFASTAVTVVIIIVAVVIVGALFAALGPLSGGEQQGDDLKAEMGPLGTTRLDQQETRAELGDDSGWAGPDAEERLDQRNE
jgi:type II secretory pathway pseudopilin PulG